MAKEQSSLILTIEEEYPLDIPRKTVAQLKRLYEDSRWEYISTATTMPGRVVAVVSAFNGVVNELQALAFLKEHPELKLRGSGAWVLEADLRRQSCYDHRGWKSYPDQETSRWRYRDDGSLYGVVLWGGCCGKHDVWRRDFAGVQEERQPGDRFVFVRSEA